MRATPAAGSRLQRPVLDNGSCVQHRERVPGPDVPPSTEPLTLDAYWYRWPTGAEKVALVEGALLFAGEFDERDVRIASRAYPGRRVEIDEEGLWMRPQDPGAEDDG